MQIYGGGANPPVRLDPWQNIVGVGWGGNFVAIQVWIEGGTGAGLPEPDAPPSEDMEYVGTSWDGWARWPGGCATEFGIQYYLGEQTYVDIKEYDRATGLWGPASGGVTVSGLPNISLSGSRASWTTTGVDEMRWQGNVGGQGHGLSVPDEPGVPFNFSVTPNARMVANKQGGGEEPQWRYIGASPGIYTQTGYASPLVGPDLDIVIDDAVHFGDLLVHVGTKAFRPTSTAVSASATYALWILCKRSPADDLA